MWESPHLLLAEFSEDTENIIGERLDALSAMIPPDSKWPEEFKKGVSLWNKTHSENATYMVMPYAGVSARKLQKARVMTQRGKLAVCQATFSAITEMHNIGYAHNDLHLGQVIVTCSGDEIRLCDFGKSVKMNEISRYCIFKDDKCEAWRFDFIRFQHRFMAWIDDDYKHFGDKDKPLIDKLQEAEYPDCHKAIAEWLAATEKQLS